MPPLLDSAFVFPSANSSTPQRRSHRQHSLSLASNRAVQATDLFRPQPTTSIQAAPTFVSSIFSTPVRQSTSVGSKRPRRLTTTPSWVTSSGKRSRQEGPPVSPSPSSSTVAETLSPGSPPQLPAMSLSPLFAESPKASILQDHGDPVRKFSESFAGMSFLSAKEPNYLAAKVEVVLPNDGVVNMIGPVITASNYSLSGNVLLDLPVLPAGLKKTRARQVEMLLIELEGKSEFHHPTKWYTPLRVHDDVLTVISSESPLELPSEDSTGSISGRYKVAIPFDLRLPGWLPSSHDAAFAHLSYGLKVHARISWTYSTTVAHLGKIPRRVLAANPSLNPLTSRDNLSAYTGFEVVRHSFPVGLDSETALPSKRYFHLPHTARGYHPIDCMITVPEILDLNGDAASLRIELQLRRQQKICSICARRIGEAHPAGRDTAEVFDGTADSAASTLSAATTICQERSSQALSEGARDVPKTTIPAEAKIDDTGVSIPQLRIKSLGMEVVETESYSSRAYPAFMATFPVSEDQPAPDNPRYPFIGPRPAYALDRSPERRADARARTSTEKRCLLDPQGRQRDFVFNNGGVLMGNAFRNINVVLPIPTANTSAALAGGFPRSAMFGPFYHRRHSLVIRLVIDDSPVDQPGKNKEKVVTWRVPIQLATSILTIPGAETSVSVPPYAQIFHENGEARMCEPLPLYTKTSDTVLSPSPADPPIPSYLSLFSKTTTPSSSCPVSLTEETEPCRPNMSPASTPSRASPRSEIDACASVSPSANSARLRARTIISRLLA